jgi:hypothetical protein
MPVVSTRCKPLWLIAENIHKTREALTKRYFFAIFFLARFVAVGYTLLVNCWKYWIDNRALTKRYLFAILSLACQWYQLDANLYGKLHKTSIRQERLWLKDPFCIFFLALLVAVAFPMVNCKKRLKTLTKRYFLLFLSLAC